LIVFLRPSVILFKISNNAKAVVGAPTFGIGFNGRRLLVEESVPLPAVARQRLVEQIEDEVLGLGPLEPLLKDISVSDILSMGIARFTWSVAAS
jgi:hypothetical protein